MASPRGAVVKTVENPRPVTRRKPATRKAKPVSPARTSLRSASGRVAVRGTNSGLVTSLFNEQLEEALLGFVRDSDVLLGCVAWVTNRQLLGILGTREVSLVMQNERTLTSGAKGASLRAMLAKLDNSFEPEFFDGPVTSSRRRWTTGIPAVNVVGVQSHRGTRALMHHKFLIRAKVSGRGKTRRIDPLAVWTGSMNFSHGGAERFLENAVIIDDPVIAASYLGEFQSVLVASKPLTGCS